MVLAHVKEGKQPMEYVPSIETGYSAMAAAQHDINVEMRRECPLGEIIYWVKSHKVICRGIVLGHRWNGRLLVRNSITQKEYLIEVGNVVQPLQSIS